MFDTDLGREYDAAAAMGLSARGFYEAGVEGALCDEPTKEALRRLGAEYDWASADD
jgi:aminodeoxyfutalosine deaminase